MANKALFLDRDGVINIDYGYVYKIKDFKFRKGIFDFCKRAQNKNYLIIIITNQSGIERGYYSEEDFLILNKYMINKFKKHNIIITDVFYCPYLQSYDRKPNPGMIIKAVNKYDISLKDSILIGDKQSDILTGKNAGILKNYLIHKNTCFRKIDIF